jgi:hypothetical protein
MSVALKASFPFLKREAVNFTKRFVDAPEACGLLIAQALVTDRPGLERINADTS